VVPKLLEHDRAYIFQATDGRVVFALPFEGDFTMVGTTDRDYSGDPGAIVPDEGEIAYLCSVVNDHFRKTVRAADVIWSFAGVRPLHGEETERPQDTPRDYLLALDRAAGEAPLLTIVGGKITTYRRLAEEAVDKLAPVFGVRAAWTAGSVLPGGDFGVDGLERLVAGMRVSWPFLTDAHARRLARAYGTRVREILGNAASLDDLGPNLGADLTAAEARYLAAKEWAQTEDDVLWRRTKLGLRVSSRADRSLLATILADTIGRTAVDDLGDSLKF
jgi:glycerol-3-phosphate dehydrogenase